MNGNLQAAIFKYKEYRRSNPDTCILHCKNQTNLSEAIYFACISEDAQGKRHSHQYRLKKQDMEIFSHQLQSQEQRLRDADNFDTLFKIINNIGL